MTQGSNKPKHRNHAQEKLNIIEQHTCSSLDGLQAENRKTKIDKKINNSRSVSKWKGSNIMQAQPSKEQYYKKLAHANQHMGLPMLLAYVEPL